MKAASLQHSILALGEKKGEATRMCMVIGLRGEGEDAARIAFFGLFAGQHRGQESAGIAAYDGERLRIHKGMGLVNQAFTEEIIETLTGKISVAHTRYSTTGTSNLLNGQPIVFQACGMKAALVHNGDIMNALTLRQELESRGVRFGKATSDSIVIAKLIAHSKKTTIEERVIETMHKIHGAYSFVLMAGDKLIAAKDPCGIRPLCVGRLNGDHYVVASESCALSTIGATYLREVEPGEMLVMDDQGLRACQAVPCRKHALCIFEFVYFARPDSKMYGKTLYTTRLNAGRELAKEHPTLGAHIVFGMPDTATPAGHGYAEESGIPYVEGVIKSRYIHRTFIQPDQRMREMGVRMKISPLRDMLAGRKVVMVEDSIVRGTTTGQTVRILKEEGGAAEVYVRIASPPYKNPCYLGIDTSKDEQLIAARMSVEEICEHIGADSLGYLSMGGLIRAIGVPKDWLCRACLDGQYPIEPIGAGDKNRLELAVAK